MPRLKLSNKTPQEKLQYWLEVFIRNRTAYGRFETKRRIGVLLWYAALNNLPVPRDFMSEYDSDEFELVTPTTDEVKTLHGKEITTLPASGDIFDNVIGEKK